MLTDLRGRVCSHRMCSICRTLDREEAFIALTELWSEFPMTRDDLETLFSYLDVDNTGAHKHHTTHTHTHTHTHRRLRLGGIYKGGKVGERDIVIECVLI